MILDIAKQSLLSPRVLIPVEELLGNAKGSRMPEVNPELLTLSIAEQVVAACPTSALKLHASAEHTNLSLDYGECIGCGRCFAPSNGAFFPAERLTCCGVSRQGLVRKWDLQSRKEIIADEPKL